MSKLTTLARSLKNLDNNLNRVRLHLRTMDISSLEEDVNKLEKKVLVEFGKSLVASDTRPNENEINLGITQGKIAAIKAYRERTGAGLADSKKTIEDFFASKGYTFHQYSYSNIEPEYR